MTIQAVAQVERCDADDPTVVDHYERRGAQRYSKVIGLRWRVQGKWARRTQSATIVNISRSGARIRARVDKAITVGSLVEISVGRGRGVVEVRRIEISPEPTIAYYGVQFFELDARLNDLVLDLTRPTRTPAPLSDQ